MDSAQFARFMKNRRETHEIAQNTRIDEIAQNEIELLKTLIDEKAAEIAETLIEWDETPYALELLEIARDELIGTIVRKLKEKG